MGLGRKGLAGPWIYAGILIALVLVSSACYLTFRTPSQQGERVVTDMAGRQISVPKKLERIVCLTSEPLELLYLLGESEKVVGAGTWAMQGDPILTKLYNFSKIPDVGSFSNPNVEAIISLRPDLVITYCSKAYGPTTPAEVIEQLESAGIPVFGIVLGGTKPADWDLYYGMVENLGVLVGKEDRAREISTYLKKVFESFEEEVRKIRENEKVKVVYTWSEMTQISGSFDIGSTMIGLAGGVNIGGGLPQPYPTVSPEFIVEKNPDVWIITWNRALRGGRYGVSDVLSDPRFANVSAVKNGRVFEEPNMGSAFNPVRAHLYLLWHGKIYYGIPDFDSKAKEISKKFYGIENEWWK